MLRNILRTSRWLARSPINTRSLALARQFAGARNLNQISAVNIANRKFSATNNQTADHVDPVVFDQVCNETLESLCDYFEELIEDTANFKGADVTYSDGVLTVDLGKSYGIYVINRQTPNKQIWLSSPVSGPKRYDLVMKNGGYWVYKHDGMTLHNLLQSEISKLTNKVDFSKCSHGIV